MAAGKCAHGPCECTVDPDGEWGAYCSALCELQGKTVDLVCECGHPACKRP
jgi:hypothetical protein